MAGRLGKLDKTVSFAAEKTEAGPPFFVSVFTGFSDKQEEPELKNYNLKSDFDSGTVRFGRSADNDIVINSPLVSSHHGHFEVVPQAGEKPGIVKVFDDGSTNKIYVNGTLVKERVLKDNDIVRIDNINRPLSDGVLMLMSASEATTYKMMRKLRGKKIIIGRSAQAGLRLLHLTVSRRHISLDRTADSKYMISNLSQTNPVIVNSDLLLKPRVLKDRDVILLSVYELIYIENVGLIYKEDPENLSAKVKEDVAAAVRHAENEKDRKRAERYNKISTMGKMAEALSDILSVFKLGA